jgi:hypothetical protein
MYRLVYVNWPQSGLEDLGPESGSLGHLEGRLDPLGQVWTLVGLHWILFLDVFHLATHCLEIKHINNFHIIWHHNTILYTTITTNNNNNTGQ